MFEVEAKYRIDDQSAFRKRLGQIGLISSGEPRQYCDTYFSHPCRNFAETHEALRLRKIDGDPRITYKGPLLAEGVKAREELEWDLTPGDPEGEKTAQLLQALGFRVVANVLKMRESFRLGDGDDLVTATFDQLAEIGCYAEIEVVVRETREIEPARNRIEDLAKQLGLLHLENRSYLNILLDHQ